MASKYDGLARIIIQNVGGKQNIKAITHCITRLRFQLVDEGKANTDILNKTDGVIKVIQANGQYQVVIGNAVAESTTLFWKSDICRVPAPSMRMATPLPQMRAARRRASLLP